MNNNEEKTNVRKRIILLIVTIALVLAVVGITYAFMNLDFTDNLNTEVINVTGGQMNITYEGGPIINVGNIIPGDEAVAVKEFTIVGNNTHDNYTMRYVLGLEISSNTFTDEAITYTLESANLGTTGSLVPSQSTQIPLATGAGSQPLGEGSFDFGTNSTHRYIVRIFFPDRGFRQNENQGQRFSARVTVAHLP